MSNARPVCRSWRYAPTSQSARAEQPQRRGSRMKGLRFFLRAIGRRLLRRSSLFRTRYVEELPNAVIPGNLYVVVEDGFLWCAALICPCSCGEALQMSLLSEGRPRWTFAEHKDGTPTLSPSVWRQVGCRSHFFLRRGIIIWCDD
jgi:hypothetical protein